MRAVAALLALLAVPAHALEADDVVWGCEDVGYVEPTTEYGHDVLGGAGEYKGLMMLVHTDLGVLPATMTLPEGKVFEDLAPRCADLDGDGEQEVVAVISDVETGASLTVLSKRTGPIDATPPIGQRNRWLAPAGIADFDGDGQNDIAYVETPHLGGLLRFWTLRDGRLVEIAQLAGFSNHRIGDDFVAGGVRTCNNGPELVLPAFDWQTLRAVHMEDGKLVDRQIAADTAAQTIADAMECKEN